MNTQSKVLRIALAVAFVLTCKAGTIAEPDFVKCNKATCTEACDASAPGTGHCVDMDGHFVQVTILECCCCVGFKHTKNLRFYPYN
jgi:hypothetical protein